MTLFVDDITFTTWDMLIYDEALHTIKVEGKRREIGGRGVAGDKWPHTDPVCLQRRTVLHTELSFKLNQTTHLIYF